MDSRTRQARGLCPVCSSGVAGITHCPAEQRAHAHQPRKAETLSQVALGSVSRPVNLTVHGWRKEILSERGPSTALARLVALALAQHMSAQTCETFVGVELLTTDCSLSERAVRGQLQLLVREKFLHEETASRGRAHWRKVRRARLPSEAGVPAPHAGTQRLPAPRAASQSKRPRVPAYNVTSAGISAHRVPARGADDLVDLSRSDLGAALPSPATAGKAARARKAPEAPSEQEIIAGVRRLIAAGIDDAQIIQTLPRYRLTLERVQAVRTEAA
jgi:hypothetical protein